MACCAERLSIVYKVCMTGQKCERFTSHTPKPDANRSEDKRTSLTYPHNRYTMPRAHLSREVDALAHGHGCSGRSGRARASLGNSGRRSAFVGAHAYIHIRNVQSSHSGLCTLESSNKTSIFHNNYTTCTACPRAVSLLYESLGSRV